MRVAFFVIVISISVSAFARIIVNEGEEFEPRFMLSGDSRIPPSLAIHNDINNCSTERQNKADRGATKLRSESYFQYVAATR